MSTTTAALQQSVIAEQIARLVYEATFGSADGMSSDRFGENMARAAARLAIRRLRPEARQAGIERGARAIAALRDWSWPDLHGYAPADRYGQPITDDVGRAKALKRQRAELRLFASTAIHAFLRHLEDGIEEDTP